MSQTLSKIYYVVLMDLLIEAVRDSNPLWSRFLKTSGHKANPFPCGMADQLGQLPWYLQIEGLWWVMIFPSLT